MVQLFVRLANKVCKKLMSMSRRTGQPRSSRSLNTAERNVIAAGVTALVLAVMMGPRRDFKRVPTVPHRVPFALLGAGLLWFGWFGFNAGSALVLDGIAANALVTTHSAGAAAFVTWILIERLRSGNATVGIIGALLTGVFARRAVNPNGADGLLAGTPQLVAIQLLAVVATVAFAALGTFVILTALRAVMPMRIAVDEEMAGIHV